MRTCLFLSSAIALVALTATTTADAKKSTTVSSYTIPNDESNASGYFSLINRETTQNGFRQCTILDRGETQVFRNLWPANRRGDRMQVLKRNVHNESHGGSHSHEENLGAEESKDLFELNTNSMDWSLMEEAFLDGECDQVKDETIDNNSSASVDDFEGLMGDHGTRQQVLERHGSGLREGDEVRKLVDNGPDRNRVDIVFMGDGYTLEEREKFFTDMQRLVNDMFIGDTFQSFLPLFNVHALFRPSKESGIGVNGHWKDTSFRLYRDGTELRGIYVADPRAAREACRAVGKYACDFPSLIGNDPYYGGLGGEFVISTSSNKSGTIVLRHELGHSLINVGEEYDGGQVYSGVNAERWSIQNIKWKHWLTDAVPREEKNVLRAQDYAWYDLKKGPYKVKFNSDGNFKRWSLKISHSGVDTDDSFEAYVDGKRLNWTSPGGYDRDFSEWNGEEGFSAGPHELEFRQGSKYDDEPVDGSRPIRQLCSVTMHEFMGEDQYRFDNTIISAYPTYDLYGRKTWRSNHEFCLMRNMASTQFCSICKEGLWHRLLSKASLLDEIQVDCQREDKGGDEDDKISSFGIEAKLIPLGQLREDQSKRAQGEAYTIRWFRNGAHQAELDDQTQIDVPAADEGIWEFKTEFSTPQVRKDPRGLLKASKVFVLAKHLCTK
ncbi:MAG: IgA peptidase M64-domain-containing protein [Linnemannia gamsii]|nr:MAG: IgA peptidase M64-domain-containing protein [Linnemannia gamsii]